MKDDDGQLIPDDPSDAKLSFVLPELALRWKAVRQVMWNVHKLQIKVTSGFRSFQNQNELYAIGRKQIGKTGVWQKVGKTVTNAMGGQSWHCFGLALDSCFMGDDPYLDKFSAKERDYFWDEFGKIATDIGLVWGGSFKSVDLDHVELTYGLSLEQAQYLFNKSKSPTGVFEFCAHCEKCGRKMAT